MITEHWWKYTERGKPKKPKHDLWKVLNQVCNPRGHQLTTSASAQTVG